MISIKKSWILTCGMVTMATRHTRKIFYVKFQYISFPEMYGLIGATKISNIKRKFKKIDFLSIKHGFVPPDLIWGKNPRWRRPRPNSHKTYTPVYDVLVFSIR